MPTTICKNQRANIAEMKLILLIEASGSLSTS